MTRCPCFAVVVICDLGNRGVLASFLLEHFGMGHGYHPCPPRSLATLKPPCSRREFQMGQVPWMKLAPLEADRLPDQDRLFRCRQVEQGEGILRCHHPGFEADWLVSREFPVSH